MDNRYFEFVVLEMENFFKEQGFKATDEEGVYANAVKQIKIAYDEDKQVYRLFGADITEQGAGEYAELSTYLFDDSQTKRDAASVGIDFVDTLRKNMGVKVQRRSTSGEIDLPTNQKSGTVTVSGLTAKLLAVYPEFKDSYKESVAKNGKFLYLEFYRENFIGRINRTISQGNKKQTKKLFDTLSDCYISGDKEACTLIIATVTAAVYSDNSLFETAKEAMGEGSYLIPLVTNFIPELKKNKKLQSALIK